MAPSCLPPSHLPLPPCLPPSHLPLPPCLPPSSLPLPPCLSPFSLPLSPCAPLSVSLSCLPPPPCLLMLEDGGAEGGRGWGALGGVWRGVIPATAVARKDESHLVQRRGRKGAFKRSTRRLLLPPQTADILSIDLATCAKFADVSSDLSTHAGSLRR